LKKEFEKRGVEALQASWAAGQTVWSLERETVHGETALDLAKLAHVQVLSTTPDGLLKVRLSLGSEWTRYFVIFGALLGIFAGNMLGGLEGAGVAVGLALGLFLGWVFAFLANFASKGCQGKKSKEKAKQAEKAEVALALTSASAAAAKASSDDDTTADTSTTSSSLLTPQERKLAALAQVVQDLEQAGARSAVQRWLNVKLARTTKFFAFTAYCAAVLPFVQLRDTIDGRPLSEAFLKLRLPCSSNSISKSSKAKGGGDKAAYSRKFASVAASAVVALLLFIPFLVLVVSKAAAKALAAVQVVVLFLWVCLILQRALSEERLWKPPRPRLIGNKGAASAGGGGGSSVRPTAANFSVLLVFVLEWQQLSAVGLTPPVSWPSAVPLPSWYSLFNLNLGTLGQALHLNNFLETDYGASSSASLGNLRTAEALTFWVNLLYTFAWFLLVGFLASACIVRNSPALMRKYPFVRSDFYGQIPGAHVLVPSLASALFLSVLSSMLGVLACAFVPTDDDSGEVVDDDERALLTGYQQRTCFEGSHRVSVAISLWGLLYYLPSAFLVGISFLNDEKNEEVFVLRSYVCHVCGERKRC
jgi:hypothetical protein